MVQRRIRDTNQIHGAGRCRGAIGRGLRGKVFTSDRTVTVGMSVDRVSHNRPSLSPCGLTVGLTQKYELAFLQFIEREVPGP